MPSILQINVTANWGSTGKIAEQIGQTTMRNGWDSYIANGRMMNPSKSLLIKVGSQIDVYSHYAVGKVLDAEGLLSKRATKQLVKTMEEINPDVVHLHNIHDHYLNYPVLFRYLAARDIPVVWTQHDVWAATGGCCYTPQDCSKWKNGCNHCPQKRGLGIDRSQHNYKLKKDLFTAVKSLTIVPVSEWLGDMLAESFLNKNDIRAIHNGIDIDTFKPSNENVAAKYNTGNKKIVLGVASEWSERKGLKDIIKLATLLPKEEFAIIVIGKVLDGSGSVSGDGCQMVFVDRTQNAKELAALYSAALVYINPTYQDNYPTTNLETMACGAPVITYYTGGSPEAVTSDTGWVIGQGEVGRMSEIIRKLGQNEKSAILTQRASCRKRAEMEFDKDKCFEKYTSLYDALLVNRCGYKWLIHSWLHCAGSLSAACEQRRVAA